MVASNALDDANNASDGSATITTGDALGNGATEELHRRSTRHAYRRHLTGLGLIANTQVAGVLNAGVGIGNSAAPTWPSGTAPRPTWPAQPQINTIDGAGGTLTAGRRSSNNGQPSRRPTPPTATRWSGTGDASRLAATRPRRPSTRTSTPSVDGPRHWCSAPRSASSATWGSASPTAALNLPVGNVSTNSAAADPDRAACDPAADITWPSSVVVAGQGSSTNASDGEACVCTGDATASGNISDTTLTQDIDLGVEGGLSIVPTIGGVLNAGFGFANSGFNLAVGNVSEQHGPRPPRRRTSIRRSPGSLLGAQIFIERRVGAKNSSDGTGKVGTRQRHGHRQPVHHGA